MVQGLKKSMILFRISLKLHHFYEMTLRLFKHSLQIQKNNKVCGNGRKHTESNIYFKNKISCFVSRDKYVA